MRAYVQADPQAIRRAGRPGEQRRHRLYRPLAGYERRRLEPDHDDQPDFGI